MSTQLTLSSTNTQFDVIGEDVDILSSLKWLFRRWVAMLLLTYTVRHNNIQFVCRWESHIQGELFSILMKP